jgi:pyruvate/2-oxoglutarate/acetoin dehydrogenase E1 component
MGLLLNSVRGMHLLVPRNMVQAAGMYNTLLQSNDPAIVVECLNGYRKKERLPSNIGDYTVPIGIPEVLREGRHITVVTYGSCTDPASKAAEKLLEFGIEVELIDVQSLLPFDTERTIVSSLKKTNKLLIVDEDVPGGASAYILQQIIEEQGGFEYLDAQPKTLTAKAHRPPYGSDGDYYTKPQTEDIVDMVYEIVFEVKMI